MPFATNAAHTRAVCVHCKTITANTHAAKSTHQVACDKTRAAARIKETP